MSKLGALVAECESEHGFKVSALLDADEGPASPVRAISSAKATRVTDSPVTKVNPPVIRLGRHTYRPSESLNLEAQYKVIGSILHEENSLDLLSDFAPENFTEAVLAQLFSAMREMRNAGQSINALTLADRLNDDDLLLYLSYIQTDCPSSANVASYAQILIEQAAKSELARITRDASAQAGSRGESAAAISQAVVHQLSAISQRSQRFATRDIGSLMTAYIEDVEQRMDGNKNLLPTDLAEVDAILGGGTGDGDLIVVGARPAMGKTSFALKIARNFAKRGDAAVVFSMEMPWQQMVDRLISLESGVPIQALRSGEVMLNSDYTERFVAGASILAELPIHIDEQPSLNLFELSAKIRLQHRQSGIRVAVVDYLQLMSGMDQRATRNSQLEEITRGLKGLAKELSIRIILLSQLNRDLERRPNKRPMAADLRESGAIEQDADVIIMLYRDEIYNPDSDAKGTAEIIFVKQRNGPLGTAALEFDGPCAHYKDMPKFRNY